MEILSYGKLKRERGLGRIDFPASLNHPYCALLICLQQGNVPGPGKSEPGIDEGGQILRSGEVITKMERNGLRVDLAILTCMIKGSRNTWKKCKPSK